MTFKQEVEGTQYIVSVVIIGNQWELGILNKKYNRVYTEPVKLFYANNGAEQFAKLVFDNAILWLKAGQTPKQVYANALQFVNSECLPHMNNFPPQKSFQPIKDAFGGYFNSDRIYVLRNENVSNVQISIKFFSVDNEWEIKLNDNYHHISRGISYKPQMLQIYEQIVKRLKTQSVDEVMNYLEQF